MEGPDFESIARLISLSPIVKIEPKQTSDGWSLYEGRYELPLQAEQRFQVVYLGSKATLDSVHQATRKAAPNTVVVYAPSLDKRIKGLKAALGSFKRSTPRDYLHAFVRNEIDVYTQRLIELAPPNYQPPNVKTNGTFHSKNPVEALLKGELTKDEEEEGVLGVLLAEGGQGKTFMTSHLASHLANSNVIPIYIRSDQWKKIAVDDLRSPAKTIVNAFRSYGAPIGWIEGHEEEFLRVTLRAGLFCILFDGFDEYVLKNQGKVEAAQALESLRDLARTAGARVLVTSRTSFWDTEIGPLNSEERIYRYQIEPFDQQQGRAYFGKRLGTGRKADAASSLYARLLKKNKDLAGRGFVLDLVADLAERTEDPSALAPEKAKNLVWWLLEKICDRERERHALPLSAAGQLSALQLYVAEQSKGLDPCQESLELVLASTDLRDDERRSCVLSLRQHPLLNASDWKLRHDQVRFILLAKFLVEAALDEAGGRYLADFVEQTRLPPEDAGEVAAEIVELADAQADEAALLKRVRALVPKMIAAGAQPDVRQPARRLAVAVTIAAIDRLQQKAESADRTNLLLSLLGTGGILRAVPLFGTLNRFDLCGIALEDCHLDQVTFVNCKFDAQTRFAECHLENVRAERCDGFGLAAFDHCRLDEESRVLQRNEAIHDKKRAYVDDDLKEDIGHVVKKFVGRSGRGVKNVKEPDLSRGPISRSPHKEAIISELFRNVLEPHHMSGSSEKGVNVRPAAQKAVDFFAENNVFTGALQEGYDRLAKKLGIA